ncbi:hypothetical protein D3C71_1387410 [compost metagenome]
MFTVGENHRRALADREQSRHAFTATNIQQGVVGGDGKPLEQFTAVTEKPAVEQGIVQTDVPGRDPHFCWGDRYRCGPQLRKQAPNHVPDACAQFASRRCSNCSNTAFRRCSATAWLQNPCRLRTAWADIR